MATITITEALAELNTIKKRLAKKRESVVAFLTRSEGLKDPLEKQGGSPEFIRRELQAIVDLETRHRAIRIAIQRRNQETLVRINDREMTVAEWLTYRKEQSVDAQRFLSNIRQTIDKVRSEATRKGNQVVTVGSAADLKPTDVIVNIDEAALSKQIEALEDVLGQLDGRLSLINATTTIEV
jgi:hypothetical protein